MSTKAKTAKVKSPKPKKPRTLAEMHELIDLPQIRDALNRLSVQNAAKDSVLENRINALWDAIRDGAVVAQRKQTAEIMNSLVERLLSEAAPDLVTEAQYQHFRNKAAPILLEFYQKGKA